MVRLINSLNYSYVYNVDVCPHFIMFYLQKKHPEQKSSGCFLMCNTSACDLSTRGLLLRLWSQDHVHLLAVELRHKLYTCILLEVVSKS